MAIAVELSLLFQLLHQRDLDSGRDLELENATCYSLHVHLHVHTYLYTYARWLWVKGLYLSFSDGILNYRTLVRSCGVDPRPCVLEYIYIYIHTYMVKKLQKDSAVSSLQAFIQCPGLELVVFLRLRLHLLASNVANLQIWETWG